MNILKTGYSWLVAPVIFLVTSVVLTWIGLTCSPEWIQFHFNGDGASPVEAATIGLFYFFIAFVWFVPPMAASRRATFWKLDFSLLSLIAICRELDWHKLLVSASGLPGATHGTAFKMKFLTNSANPLGDRILVALFFLLFFVVVGGTLLRFLPRLWKGIWKLHPVCWTIGCLGGAGILCQVFDRIPSVLRKKFAVTLSPETCGLLSALEEGFEILLPIFGILAVLQSYQIYVARGEDDAALQRWRT